MQDLGVVVNRFVEATVVALYHIVHQRFYAFLLRLELQTNGTRHVGVWNVSWKSKVEGRKVYTPMNK